MEAKKIRLLTEDEIECRVAQCGMGKYGAWCTLLLYKDARVDMRILDEVYGQNNWQREHTLIGDRLYCTISIWDEEKKQWIKKQDVGTESNTEKEKGQASDSFKRAGFNVGIGRELYTAPFIRINLKDGEFDVKKDQYGKDRVSTYSKFNVAKITHNEDGSIAEVFITDEQGEVRFPKNGKLKNEPAPAPQPAQTPEPVKKKPTFDLSHPKWQEALDKMVAGQGSIAELQKTFFIPAHAEEAIKDYLKKHIKQS